jgi:hypothetical protein
MLATSDKKSSILLHRVSDLLRFTATPVINKSVKIRVQVETYVSQGHEDDLAMKRD